MTYRLRGGYPCSSFGLVLTSCRRDVGQEGTNRRIENQEHRFEELLEVVGLLR